MPLKTNRKVTVSLSAKQNGHYQRVDTLELEPMQPVTVYLESVSFALLLIQQVFTNEDGTTVTSYLVTSDTTLSGESISTIYQKRWNVELYHKSLKQNAALEKSPTQTVTISQTISLQRCVAISNSNYLKSLPNSTISRSNQSYICRLFNLLTPHSENSTPLPLLRKVSD